MFSRRSRSRSQSHERYREHDKEHLRERERVRERERERERERKRDKGKEDKYRRHTPPREERYKDSKKRKVCVQWPLGVFTHSNYKKWEPDTLSCAEIPLS